MTYWKTFAAKGLLFAGLLAVPALALQFVSTGLFPAGPGVAMAAEDDPVRNGLRIVDPVPQPAPARATPSDAEETPVLLQNWTYTNTVGTKKR